MAPSPGGQKEKPRIGIWALGPSSVEENLVKSTQLDPQAFLKNLNNQEWMVFGKNLEQ